MGFTSSFLTLTPSLCVFRKNMHVKRLSGRIKAKGETEETDLGFCSNSTVTVSAVTWKNRYCSHTGGHHRGILKQKIHLAPSWRFNGTTSVLLIKVISKKTFVDNPKIRVNIVA